MVAKLGESSKLIASVPSEVSAVWRSLPAGSSPPEQFVGLAETSPFLGEIAFYDYA